MQVSSWESKGSNLREFMKTVHAEGGWGKEAIEVGFNFAVQESETDDGISQVILIGDAPANDKQDVETKRNDEFGEKYWKTTKFAEPTYYQDELEKLKAKNIPIHSFYLNNFAKSNFVSISQETSGRHEELNLTRGNAC